MVLLLPLHLDTARPQVQRIPYFQQDAVAVLPPLMVPKPQHMNVLGRKKGFARGVRRQLVRQTVLKPVQFHGQPRRWAIYIQEELSRGMLAAELESGKPARAQGLPKLPLFFGLFAAKLPGAGGWIHPKSITGGSSLASANFGSGSVWISFRIGHLGL